MINDIKNVSKEVQYREAEVLYLAKSSATRLLQTSDEGKWGP